MNSLQVNPGIKRKKQVMKYSVILFVVNSMHTKSVKKRFLNFYKSIRPVKNGSQTNESKRIP